MSVTSTRIVGRHTYFVKVPGRHVPNPCSLIARAGNDEPAILGEVEGVNLLLVPIEDGTYTLVRDVPDLDRSRKGDMRSVRVELHQCAECLPGSAYPLRPSRVACRLD